MLLDAADGAGQHGEKVTLSVAPATPGAGVAPTVITDNDLAAMPSAAAGAFRAAAQQDTKAQALLTKQERDSTSAALASLTQAQGASAEAYTCQGASLRVSTASR